jgi:hypothetical protein
MKPSGTAKSLVPWAGNGSSWYLSGAPDFRWNDDELNTLKCLIGNDFEVVGWAR